MDISSKTFDYKEAKNTAERALKLWPKNREAHSILYNFASQFFDDQTAEKAKSKYQEIGGQDSAFLFNKYNFTGDERYLEKALEQYPANTPAFIGKARILAKRDESREAKFNFAVAANCVANSAVLDLKKFYIENAEVLGKLFGKSEMLKILRQFNRTEENNFSYHLALYDVDGDRSHLDKIIQNNLLPASPYQRFLFYDRARVHDSKYLKKLEALKSQFAHSKIFRSLVART